MKEPFENLFWRLFQWVRVVLMGLGLLLLIVTFTPLTAWWTQLLEGPWTEARGDVLVVLTGSILGNGILGESSYWRSVYTVIAWQEGGWREVLVSGGGAGRVETADGMRIFLEAGGVPSSAIVVETKSHSTRDSALNVKAALERVPGRKVLLTSDYHMFRAWRAFRKVGLDVTPRPIPDAGKRAHSWNLRWPAFQDLLVETVKIAYYYARGWI
ncbi:MAG: YdcF family protein [Terriglobia bacterium]